MSLFNLSKTEEKKNEVTNGAPATRARREIAPAVDIYENADELVVYADVPGVSPEGLQVHFDAAELRFEGQRSGEPEVTYTRTFRVNERIDPNGVTAEVSQGVLTIRLKKAAEVKPRKIEVRAA